MVFAAEMFAVVGFVVLTTESAMFVYFSWKPVLPPSDDVAAPVVAAVVIVATKETRYRPAPDDGIAYSVVAAIAAVCAVSVDLATMFAPPPTPLGMFAETLGGLLESFCHATLTAFAGAAGVELLRFIVCAMSSHLVLEPMKVRKCTARQIHKSVGVSRHDWPLRRSRLVGS